MKPWCQSLFLVDVSYKHETMVPVIVSCGMAERVLEFVAQSIAFHHQLLHRFLFSSGITQAVDTA